MLPGLFFDEFIKKINFRSIISFCQWQLALILLYCIFDRFVCLSFQTVFGANIREMCEENSMKLKVPPEYPSAFFYIVTKVSEGCDKAFTSLYPPLMKVLAILA